MLHNQYPICMPLITSTVHLLTMRRKKFRRKHRVLTFRQLIRSSSTTVMHTHTCTYGWCGVLTVYLFSHLIKKKVTLNN